ncbi:glycosyltransferase family 2 protein [Nakamurella alba]|uniref:glycosyltransferase family 2 protein n=1 Tax=Nakamurella alba TaxID=2665158 RepID=UPI0018AA9216|nr:glycosyltransferase [Nakamurella alba]
MTPAGPPISLVVVTRGDEQLLRTVLPAALDAGVDTDRDEILVVIDGPGAPGAAALAAGIHPVVRVLVLPENRGAALARLAGVGAAKHGTVLLIDDDVRLTPGAVQVHRDFHQRSAGGPVLLVGAMPVAAPAHGDADTLPVRVYAESYRRTVQTWIAAPATLAESLWTGHLSARRQDILAAESVAPTVRLDYFEDLDLGLRLSLLGVRMHYSPAARADHLHRKDLAGFFREARSRGTSLARLSRRWPMLHGLQAAPSGQEVLRTFTGAVLRRRWAERMLAGLVRAAGMLGRGMQERVALLSRHLLERAWYDQERLADHPEQVQGHLATVTESATMTAPQRFQAGA